MTSPIQTTQTVYQQAPQPIGTHNNEVHTTAFRRRIKLELLQINDLLRHSPLQDEMTKAIRSWYGDFKGELFKRPDERVVFEKFVLVLQEMLIDPIYFEPLDEGSCLGSDGFTYGKLAYEVWRGNMPEPFRNYSPKDRENTAPLLLSPHPIVREMVEWLKGHNALPRSEKLERASEELMMRQREQMVARRRAKRAEMQQEKEAERMQFQAEMAIFCQDVAGPFREFREHKNRESDRICARIQEIRQHDKEGIADVRSNMDQLDLELRAFKEEAADVARRQDAVGDAISTTERQSAQFQGKIDELRAANKKRKKGWKKGMFKTLVMAGGCTLTSWAVYELLPTSGLSVVPSVNGPMLNWIKPI